MIRNQNLGPIERAAIGHDRSFARSALVAVIAADIADGYASCSTCQRRLASHVKAVDGTARALCDVCHDDVVLDEQIARQRRRRAAMGTTR